MAVPIYVMDTRNLVLTGSYLCHLPAMGYGCVCTTGTVRHKAEVQSKSQREKLFSDMSWAPFAAVGKQVQSMQSESTASKSYELNPGRMTYHQAQRRPAPPPPPPCNHGRHLATAAAPAAGVPAATTAATAAVPEHQQ